jgi:predicted peptidase
MISFRPRFVSAGVLLTIGVLGLLLPGLSAQEPGKVQTRTYDFTDAGKKDMAYALFVPTGYDKERKTPLVVALHGLGSNPRQIMNYTGLTAAAQKHGCLVAAPMGYTPRGWYGQPIPKKLTKADDPANLSELSEKDVMNVLAAVRKDFNVDPDRIYLMGHSMGGGGTWHLALKYPDIWAGLAPIAPAIFRQATAVEKIKHIPVILVQGDQDKLCPVENARRWAEQMKKHEMTYDYVEVAGGNHVDVAMKNMGRIFDFLVKHQRKAKTP